MPNYSFGGESDDTNLTVSHDSGEHSLTISAVENFFGQTSLTLYVGHEDDPIDEMEVSIIVTPVNDAPTAGFSFSVDGSNITFTDMSNDALDASDGGIVAWEWDFGDGNTSTDQNPIYDYAEVGEFTATLTVTDNGGLTAMSSETIMVVEVSTENENGLPTEYALQQNYPNPFNPNTMINYSLPEAGVVSIVVYDILGQKVADLVNTTKSAGYHSISFDASALSSGVYIYQIKAGSFIQTKKMMLIK